MGLDFLRRSKRNAERVAIFPGTWNPPTVAHVAIARAAARWAGEVIWVIPRFLPHKAWEGATFKERCGMIRAIAAEQDEFSAAIAEGGLYIDMARDARAEFGDALEIGIVCGRDAAERIETWDYGRPGVFEEVMQEFRLLVAAREGEYATALEHNGRVQTLQMEAGFDDISSTEVRRRIGAGQSWEGLVPEVIVDEVRRIYGPASRGEPVRR